MKYVVHLGSVACCGVCLLVGCGKGDSNVTPVAGNSATPVAPAESNPTNDAIVRAASDFLDAVLKGDPQRASARLTPQAIERIISSGKQFQPQGLQTADFRIGEIRTPSQNQAIVQCVLTEKPTDGGEQSEEMCCLMRYVENDWRVSGIAYGKDPTQPWTLTDFETGQTASIARQATQSTPPAGRPSPPRTAEESPAVLTR